ncbi:MAG: leucine-rich repeat domain-containing protein, partial [Clostridia bacterium]
CPMPTKTDNVFQGWYDGETQITDNLGASIATLTGENNKVFNLTAKWALQTEGMAISGTTLTQYTGTAQYVVIPDTVTSIGDSAFYDTKLTSITIPNSVTSIGINAFYWCLELTKVTIGSGVASIGYGAFESCYKLASITVDTGNTRYKGTGNCLVDTSTNTLLAGCNNSVIPTDGSVTSIGKAAFYGYRGLKEVVIPSTVTSIGDSAFSGCGMSSIAIPDSVTSIGAGAFDRCSGLTSVTIGSGVNSIGNAVFFGCRELTSITVDKDNIAYISVGNCLIEIATTTLIAGCQSSVIPTDGSVTKIGDYAFYGCYELTSITIPSSVTSIGEGAFRNCSGLTSIIIPGSVTSIGKSAFYSCGWLTSITIGSGVESIGSFAFNDCRRLTKITIPASVTTVGDNAFNKCDSLIEINCGAADPTPEAQPTGWDANWKGNCTGTVNWGYTGA